jgi:AraC-like DNA-binding protein
MEHALAAAALCVAIFVVFLLLQKNKRSQVYILAVSFFSLGWILAYYAASISGFLRHVPLLFHTDLVASALAGPSIYLFFITVIMEGKKPVRSFRAYFVPIIVFLVAVLAHNAIVDPLPGYRPGLPIQFSSPVLIVFNFIPDALFFTLISVGLIRSWRSRLRDEIRHIKEFRVMMAFLSALWLDGAFMLLAYPLRDERIFVVAMILDAAIVTCFFLALARIPQYMFGQLPDLRSADASPNAGVTVPAILSPAETEIARERLEKLLQNGAFYTDPDIKLHTLAARLGLTPNQLSFFLNSVMGVGFREYINGLRLERIERDLHSDTARTILQIAMDNGFASKTPFNALFQKKYGMTPSEYRKKILRDKPRDAPDSTGDN